MLIHHFKNVLRNKASLCLIRTFMTSGKRLSDAPLVYREVPKAAAKHVVRQAEIVGGLMWYWIIYHCLTQYEHITGEFPYPDPSKWTDEELGIPPDHED